MGAFDFGGQTWVATADGALFWPRRRALVVADLHLEKASWYAAGGQMLPPYDSGITLARLEALVDRFDAREVWALGDSFHDARGPDRLPPAARDRLAALTGRLLWTWIAGNHDGIVAGAGGRQLEEAVIDGLVLRHQADPADARPELSGHFHPKWKVGGRGRGVSRRCFVRGASRVILPAFGVLAGGLSADAPPIRAVAGPGARALIPVRERLLDFALP